MIHPKLKPLLLAFFVSFVVYTPFFATTIVPFDNYAEMAKASKNVVLAKVVKVFKETYGHKTYEIFEFEVKNPIKGDLSINSHFKVKTLSHTTRDGLRFILADDLNFEFDRTYLLSLADIIGGYKLPKLLNYAIFEEIKQDDRTLLIPTQNSKKVALMPTFSGKEPEEMINVDEELFINNLKLSIFKGRIWNILDSKTGKKFIAESRVAPTGCIFFGSNLTANPPKMGWRWQNILTRPIRIWQQSSGDPNLSTPLNVHSYVKNALTTLSNNYAVKFKDEGIVDFNNQCDIIAFLNGLNPTSEPDVDRKAMVTFNDPCNELEDFSQSGILAFGGAYYGCKSAHIFNNETWESACYGFVTVNSGIGTYIKTASDYSILIQHELTHTLGMGHLDLDNFPNNNMNGYCCNAINTKDRECMNYAYGETTALPVELTHFEAKTKEETVDIEWHSEIEINHDIYVLERSSNGKDFNEIKKVVGKGRENKAATYQYKDLFPNIGINFYRLRMIDKNGKEELSKTISIDFKTSKMSLKIYPNPTEGGVNFHILSPNENVSLLEVFDVTGKLISNNKIDNALKDNTLSISTKDWSKGVYIVRLSNNAAVITQKLIKS